MNEPQLKDLDLRKLMGSIVTVRAILKRYTEYRDGKIFRGWKRLMVDIPGHRHPYAGWITGFRRLQEGWRQYDYEAAFCSNYADVYLDPTNTVQCALVVFWPTMNPVPVRLDDFELGGEPEHPSTRAYRLWAKQYPKEAERFRVDMRRIMADYPRDEKGRWTKCEKP